MMNERRRKLLFRAWRRGFRELDLIIGNFAEQELEQLSDTELDEFEALLDIPDWDLYAMITSDNAPPQANLGSVMKKLRAFEYSAH